MELQDCRASTPLQRRNDDGCGGMREQRSLPKARIGLLVSTVIVSRNTREILRVRPILTRLLASSVAIARAIEPIAK